MKFNVVENTRCAGKIKYSRQKKAELVCGSYFWKQDWHKI